MRTVTVRASSAATAILRCDPEVASSIQNFPRPKRPRCRAVVPCRHRRQDRALAAARRLGNKPFHRASSAPSPTRQRARIQHTSGAKPNPDSELELEITGRASTGHGPSTVERAEGRARAGSITTHAVNGRASADRMAAPADRGITLAGRVPGAGGDRAKPRVWSHGTQLGGRRTGGAVTAAPPLVALGNRTRTAVAPRPPAAGNRELTSQPLPTGPPTGSGGTVQKQPQTRTKRARNLETEWMVSAATAG